MLLGVDKLKLVVLTGSLILVVVEFFNKIKYRIKPFMKFTNFIKGFIDFDEYNTNWQT